MTDAAETLASLGASIDEATIVSVHDGRLVVRAPSFGSADARTAIAGSYEPRVGDVVLVATTSSGGRYVVGALRALREAPSVRASDGASAGVESEAGQEVLRLRDPSGAILFEHRPGAPAVLRVPLGDLRIVADAGDLVLAAAGKVRISGREGVVTESEGQVSFRSGVEGATSELSLDGDRARLSTGLLAAKAERADAEIGEANLVASTIRTVARRIRTRADEVESQLGRVVERAREVYQEVEELAQTKAGRIKLVAEGALHVFGKSTEIKAREDVKVKGEKIYLG